MSQPASLGWIVLLASFAGLANLFGGLVVTVWVHWNRSFLKPLIAFGSGFMLAAALLEILPHSQDYGLSSKQAGLAALVGYLTMLVFERVLPGHFHYSETHHGQAEEGHRTGSSHPTYPAALGIILHSLFDGVAIGASFRVAPSLGFLLFLAALFHKIPEGATVATLVLATGERSQRALAAAGGAGAATVLGALAANLPLATIGYTLPFSAGVLLHVAASDLIPELYEEPSKALGFVVLLGAIVFGLTTQLLHATVWHHG